MKAIVTANLGFKSEKMEFVDAISYAQFLEELGNENVKVEVISHDSNSKNKQHAAKSK